jgi:hypothetical protein
VQLALERIVKVAVDALPQHCVLPSCNRPLDSLMNIRICAPVCRTIFFHDREFRLGA